MIRIDAQPTEQEHSQRNIGRANHQIETALYDRVQALHSVVEDIEQTVGQLPHDVQGALITPLTTLHSQLCGLMYVAWLFAQTHPQADDHDQ